MIGRFICSSAMATMLLVVISVGLVLMTTFTDAAAILQQNGTPVKLYSRLTEQLVTVLADGTVHANGADGDSDTNLIMEYDGTKRRFRRSNPDIYISVTPQGELKAQSLTDSSTTGSSTLFLPIESFINGLSYFKLQTTVQRQSSGTSVSTAGTLQPSLQDATCYIAVNDFLTGEPPCNVCDVPENSFSFDDEDSLLFQIDLSNGFGFGR